MSVERLRQCGASLREAQIRKAKARPCPVALGLARQRQSKLRNKTLRHNRMNETAIAVNRAAPLFRKAAELYESIQTRLTKHREATADILEAAGECGRALDGAFLSIASSGANVSETDLLAAHAPNIPLERARKLRAYAQGKYSDPRQRWLFEESESTQQERAEQSRPKPAAWEQAWGYITKLSKVETTDWPAEQLDMTRDELAAAVKRFGGEVKWVA